MTSAYRGAALRASAPTTAYQSQTHVRRALAGPAHVCKEGGRVRLDYRAGGCGSL